LDIVHLFDLFGNVISGDLGILDGGTDDDLEDTVSDGLLLELGLPDETVHLDVLHDVLCDLIEISVSIVRLDLPDDEGLGDGSGLLSLLGGISLDGISLLLKVSGVSCIMCIITVTEWIKVLERRPSYPGDIRILSKRFLSPRFLSLLFFEKAQFKAVVLLKLFSFLLGSFKIAHYWSVRFASFSWNLLDWPESIHPWILVLGSSDSSTPLLSGLIGELRDNNVPRKCVWVCLSIEVTRFDSCKSISVFRTWFLTSKEA